MTRFFLAFLYLLIIEMLQPSWSIACEQPLKSGIQSERFPQIDNKQVRTWRTIIAPNQPLKLHRHEYPRVVTVLRGGVLKSVTESGEILAVRHFKAGESYWLDADPPDQLHACVNLGLGVIEVVVTELK